MQSPVRLAAALAVLITLPASAQESGDRISFSRPTDKVNRVDERPRLDIGSRKADFPVNSPGSDGVAMATPATPALSRAQLDALKKLQADRDWALQDLQPAGETDAGPSDDGGRLSIEDLFNRSRPAGNPGRGRPSQDNDLTSGQLPAGDAARRPVEAANEFSPRARSILDGGTIFDRRPKATDSLFHQPVNDPVTTTGLTGNPKTPAERRSEQRMLNFREMLQTSVFAPSNPRADGAPGLTGSTPGLNPQYNTADPGRPGLPREELSGGTRDEGLFGGGVTPTRPNFSAFSSLGAEAGGLDVRSRALPTLEPRSTPTVPVPKFEIPRPKF